MVVIYVLLIPAMRALCSYCNCAHIHSTVLCYLRYPYSCHSKYSLTLLTHRLSTIQTADVIIAMSKGQVVEFGSHDELMEKKGLYHELVTAQNAKEEEERELSKSLSMYSMPSAGIICRVRIVDSCNRAVI